MSTYNGGELVEIAIQIERCGEAFYEAVIDHVSHPKSKEIFTFLMQDEKRHAAMFEKMLSKIVDTSAEWRESDDYIAYMRALAENRVFPDPEAARAAAESLEDESDAVRYALGFEKDTVLFFYEMRPMVKEADQKIVDALIAEEQTHVRTLSGLLDALSGKTSE